MKICCFGSLNLDHIYLVREIVQPGETISAADTANVCGGKGLNQSIAMARAGAQVWHAGNVGQDAAGDMLEKALRKEGIHTELIRKLPVPSGHAIIQIDEQGENAIIVFGGANQYVTLEQIEDVLTRFDRGDLLVLQNEVNCLPEIIRRAHTRGMRIALNPSPITQALESVPIELCDILFVNEIEAGQLCGEKNASIEMLAERYPEAMLVYTRGSKGASVYAEGKVFHQEAVRVNVVDTTGAGDTFTGYFIAAFAEGMDVASALMLAVNASGISVTRQGASVSIPLRAEVDLWMCTINEAAIND